MANIDYVTNAAGGLALDILQNGMHLPLEDGKVNIDHIEDQITIGLMTGDLQPITQEIVDLAISTVQELVDQNMADRG